MLTRFVADAMLGRLARWLRFLDYDTLYDPSWYDAHVMRLTRAEDRVLLNRDSELAKRSSACSMLVASEYLDAQLYHLQRELSINCDNEPHCPICFSHTANQHGRSVGGELPLYRYINKVMFSRCLNCGRYYWPGTQWQHIRDSLRTRLSLL